MDLDTFACGGWSAMHQPVDWDYACLLPDMFAPANPTAQQQQQEHQYEPQQQQLTQQQQQKQQAALASTAQASPAYAYFHGTWASSMHQPVDWELPMLPPTASLPAAHPAPPPLPTVTALVARQLQPAAAAVQPAPHPTASSALAATTVATAVTATAATGLQQQQQQQQQESGSNKRERCPRRSKSTALRPQQQQMLDLQKRLDALLQEHAVVEAENERLKARLRVLEAVLPVRQQQARWAQSKAAAAAVARSSALPADPLLANLRDLAASGPSSCATSPPPRREAAAATAAATPAGAGCGGSGVDAGCTAAAAEDGPTPAPAPAPTPGAPMQCGDNLTAGSPPLAPAVAPAEPASSSCGAATTATTTTSGSHPPARGYVHSLHLRSCAFNTGTRGVDPHPHPHAHPHPHPHAHPQPHPHHSQRSIGARSAAGTASSPNHHNDDPRVDGHVRWLDAWRSWVREAALLLQAYDARPNDHYLNRLEAAFTTLKSEVVFLGLRHPELVCNMRCVNLETGAELEFPPDSFWSLVVAAMKLDAQQVANCKSALALYRERMAVVLTERRSLAAQMSSCLTALQLEEAEGRALPGSMRREQLTLEAEEAASALDANVAVEGHITSLARDLLGSQLFSRLQVARASVLSYPYFPDALAIVTAAVGDDGATPTTPAPPPPPPPPPPQQQQQQQTRSSDPGAKLQVQA